MTSKEFFGKFKSWYLWGNILAMIVVLGLICYGVKVGLGIYTHHGEGIPVPNLSGMNYSKAEELLQIDQLTIGVSDSGYNKRLPANAILAQNPSAGVMVKKGRKIYVTVNSPSSPTFTIPDIIDNSSVREATAKLTAMGFRLLEPKYVVGEKDWVYGITSRGRNLAAGDRVSIDIPLTLMIGNGRYDEGMEDIEYVEPQYDSDYEMEQAGGQIDPFEEVSGPPSGSTTTPSEPVNPADPTGGMTEWE